MAQQTNSVSGFYLFPEKDPRKAIINNHATILDQCWTRSYFYQEGRLSLTKVCSIPIVYICGMIGNMADTIGKTILVAGNIFILIIDLCACKPHWIKTRFILCLDSAAALGIAVIGIFIPPLSYRLDEIVKEYMVKSFFLISY